MEPEKVYEKFMALQLHFTTPGYDFFKYHGKSRAGGNAYAKRNDKATFQRLSRKYSNQEILDLMVANFVANGGNKMWAGALLTPEAEQTYKHWLKGVQSLEYCVRRESERLKEWIEQEDFSISNLLKVEEGQHPILLKLFYADAISLETLVVYASIFKFVGTWDKQIYEEIMWPETKLLIRKYLPFLKFDRDEMKSMLREVWK